MASPLPRHAVRKLRPSDDRKAFASGNVELDRFFWLYAGQNQFRHHLGTTYVAVDEAERVVGFATVTASEIAPESLATRTKKLPRYPMPVLRLARLAVDARRKGAGVGRILLRAVFDLARTMADDFGCVGVVVDAKPESVAFYEELGFESLATVAGELGDRPVPRPMFLELGALPKRDR
jgi:GNAT superfamily N-acetyltransferase